MSLTVDKAEMSETGSDDWENTTAHVLICLMSAVLNFFAKLNGSKL